MSKLSFAIFTLAATVAPAAAAVAAPGEIINLGNLADTRPSRAQDINDAGEVVGYAEIFQSPTGPAHRAFFWSPSGGAMQNLGTFDGFGSSRAHGINGAGVTVGWAHGHADRGPERAFARPRGGSITSLGVTGGDFSRAHGINDSGDVVGTIGYLGSGAPMVDERGFLRRASDAAVIELPRPTGAISYPAFDVNDSRDVVGHFYTSSSASMGLAYLWRESTGQIIELGTFGGDTSRAEAINNDGNIVGYATDADGAAHAFVRPIAGDAITPLAEFDGALRSYAFDINDAGVIVGAADFTGTTQAVLWNAQGEPTDLDAWLDSVNPAVGAFWHIHTATAVNASGMVAGTGIYNDGAGGLSDGTRAYVLDASSLVPEPASAALLAPLALLVLRRQRR